MKKHDGCEKVFIWSSRAWYASSAVNGDEVMFGMYSSDGGGTSGEMAMRWIDLSGRKVPQLQIYLNSKRNGIPVTNDLIGDMDLQKEYSKERIPPKRTTRFTILEISNGVAKHSEDGLIMVDRFPSIPKVGQDWVIETRSSRIVSLTLFKDVDI